MGTLAETGIEIVENELFAGDDRIKLMLIAHELGLDELSPEERERVHADEVAAAALEVLTEAAASLRKIRELAGKCAA